MRLEDDHKSLEYLLEEAALLREPIIVNKNHRRIGKTTALVNFARKHGYTVLVGRASIAREIKNHFRYSKVEYARKHLLDGHKGFVYDECCPSDLLDYLKNIRRDIITGFEYVHEPPNFKSTSIAMEILEKAIETKVSILKSDKERLRELDKDRANLKSKIEETNRILYELKTTVEKLR